MEEGAEKHRGWWEGTQHEGEPEPDSFHHMRGPDVVVRQWKWDADACVWHELLCLLRCSVWCVLWWGERCPFGQIFGTRA